MPVREVPLVNGEYYHVFNRGVEKRPTFTEKRNYSRFLETVAYYRFGHQPISLSKYLKMSTKDRIEHRSRIEQSLKLQVCIISYVLMPNHFHFLLRQEVDGGTSEFIRNVSNSYTKYFNIKNDRVGPLLQGPFKCVLIEDDDQLLHVSRYIHLNPYTSLVVKSTSRLIDFPWSSFKEYLTAKKFLCDPETIMSHFTNPEKYKDFVLNQAEYQRSLESIKHLVQE